MSALIVGAGLMGRWHVHALRRLDIPVSGVVDPDGDRAKGLAGGARSYGSLDEALEGADARVAHVCSPLESHFDVIVRLLDAGLHVVAEKPVTPGAPQTLELLQAAAERDLRLCPVHQFLFQPGFMRCQERIASSGRILHVDAVALSAGAADRGPDGAERVAGEILPHPLSLMRRLLGPRFASTEWQVPRGRPGELRAVGQCEDVSLGVVVSMAGRPPRNTLRIVCEQATFHADLFHGFAVREAAPVGRASKVLRPFSLAARSTAAASLNLGARAMRWEPAYPGLREMLRRFYLSLADPEPEPIPPDETIDVARARDRILAIRRGVAPSDP